MRQFLQRPSVLAALLGLLLLLPGQFAGAQAKKDAKGKKPEKEQKAYTVNKWAYKRLSEAHEFLGKNQFNKALEIVNDMRGRKRLNEHEQTLMWQTFGYIYSGQEKFSKAIHAFENCLLLGAMPEGSLLDIQFNLGQLYMVNKQFNKAIQTFKRWLAKAQNPSPRSKYLLAMAYVQAKKPRQALRYINQALAAFKKPQESWLQLKLSVHFQLKQMKDVAKALTRLVTLYPRRTYWLQLSAAYSELNQSAKSLAVLDLAYLQKFLNRKSELSNYASLLMYHGLPYRAAKVLKKGMQDGIINRDLQSLRLLGDAWLRARELVKAITPLSKAAELDTKGDIWIRVAQIHLEREEWKKASAVLGKAIKKGKLTDAGNAHLLLGIANFRSNKLPAAKKSFEKALNYNNTKGSAQQWIRVMSQKKRS